MFAEELKKARERNAQLEKEVIRLEHDRADLASELRTHKRRADGAVKDHEVLAGQHEKLQTRYSDVSTQATVATGRVHDLFLERGELQGTRDELEEAASEIVFLKSARFGLEAQAIVLQREIASLRSSVARLEEERDGALADCERQKGEAETAGAALREAEAKLSTQAGEMASKDRMIDALVRGKKPEPKTKAKEQPSK